MAYSLRCINSYNLVSCYFSVFHIVILEWSITSAVLFLLGFGASKSASCVVSTEVCEQNTNWHGGVQYYCGLLGIFSKPTRRN